MPTHKFLKAPPKQALVHPSLDKELCILCRAVEEDSPDDIPNALRKGIGWRKALRAALADKIAISG